MTKTAALVLTMAGAMAFGACGDDGGGSEPDASPPADASVDGGPAAAAVTLIEHTSADTFTITFDQTTTDRLSVVITTTPAPHWTVAEVAHPTFTTWTVRLSDYPLPVDHAFEVNQLDAADAVVATNNMTVSATDVHTRVAFASEATGTGDILSWADLPSGSTAATGLEAADEICQAEASAAGFSGTYRALLGTDAIDLGCHLAGLSGDFSANCGEASAPSLGPWISPLGVPVLDDLVHLSEGKWRTRVAVHADQSTAPENASAWIGATALGDGDAADCADWGETGPDGAALLRVATAVPASNVDNGEPCTGTKNILCMQVDAGALALTAAHQREGKLAFVTSETFDGAPTPDAGTTTGVAAVDAFCQSLANAAGLNPSSDKTFRGYVSDDTADAACHILGFAGELAATCGEASVAGGPWVRTDGLVVANDLAALTDATLAHAILLDESGEWSGSTEVWTGTSDGAANGSDCGDWLDTGETGRIGQLDRTDADFGDETLGACTESRRFYCFEL